MLARATASRRFRAVARWDTKTLRAFGCVERGEHQPGRPPKDLLKRWRDRPKHVPTLSETTRLPSPTHDPHAALSRIEPARLEAILHAHEMFATGQPGGKRGLLKLHDLSGVDLSGRCLIGIELSGARLHRARLVCADLTDATLFTADLTEADLTEARLVRCDMRGVTLRDAIMVRCDLAGADLREGVLLTGRLQDSKREAAGHPNEPGSEYAAIGVGMPRHADLRDADLQSSRFVDAELCKADLTGCNLDQANFTRANLSNT